MNINIDFERLTGTGIRERDSRRDFRNGNTGTGTKIFSSGTGTRERERKFFLRERERETGTEKKCSRRTLV
jgi:hypothetical protein